MMVFPSCQSNSRRIEADLQPRNELPAVPRLWLVSAIDLRVISTPAVPMLTASAGSPEEPPEHPSLDQKGDSSKWD